MRDIQYKTTACGPSGSFQPGDKRQGVPDNEAMALVAGGYAIDVTPVKPVEQAVADPVEHAVSPAQPPRNTPRRGR